MRKNPLVTIIIVNWNGGSVLDDCLKSLSRISYSNFKIVLVDNGSSDGSEELVGKYFSRSRYKVIKNKKNLGFAGANNQALGDTDGKYILLLNNDTKVEKNFLGVLVEKMESDDSIGVVQPKILMMDKENYLDNAGSFMTRIGFLEHWGFGQRDSKEFEKEKEIFSAKGACMLIRGEIIQKGGLFDRTFVSYFEESDFCWRVWLMGYRVLFYPKAKIYHKVGFTIRRLDVLNINFHYYKNRIRSLIKNFGVVNLAVVLPIHLVISVGIAGLFAIRGKMRSSMMILRAIGWNAVNLPDTLSERKRVQRMRRVSDRALFSELMMPVEWRKFYGDFRRVEEDIER